MKQKEQEYWAVIPVPTRECVEKIMVDLQSKYGFAMRILRVERDYGNIRWDIVSYEHYDASHEPCDKSQGMT